MTERYVFPHTVVGLGHVIECTLHLRHFKFRTFLREERISVTDVLVVYAIPRPRPNRKERGCEI